MTFNSVCSPQTWSLCAGKNTTYWHIYSHPLTFKRKYCCTCFYFTVLEWSRYLKHPHSYHPGKHRLGDVLTSCLTQNTQLPLWVLNFHSSSVLQIILNAQFISSTVSGGYLFGYVVSDVFASCAQIILRQRTTHTQVAGLWFFNTATSYQAGFFFFFFFEWPQEIIWHKILIYLLKPSLYSVISYKPSTLIHSHIPAIPLAGTDNQVVYKLLTDFTVAFTTPQFHLQLHSNDFVVLLLQFLRNGKCNEAKNKNK